MQYDLTRWFSRLLKRHHTLKYHGRQILGDLLAMGFKLQALPHAYCVWLAGILLGYCVLTTLMKRLYIRRFG